MIARIMRRGGKGVNKVNKCKDCKWFKKVGGDWPGNSNFGLCHNPIFEEKEGDISDKALFVYWDYEGFSAGFFVHKNFGCIGFKQGD